MASLKIFQLWLVIVLAVLISAIGPVKSWPSGLGIGGQNFGPATKAQYGQYKLLRMATQGLGQKPWFLQFLSPRVDFWTSPIANGTVDVMVSPKYYRSVTNFLHSYQIPYKILMDDVQRAIDDQFKDVVDPDYENDVLKERVTVLQGGNIFSDWLQFFMRPFSNPDRPATSRQSWFPGLVRRPRKIQNNKFRKGHNMDWHSYHRLADITGYMYYLEHTYPDLCKVIEIGKSVEGRRTYILRIGSQKYSDKPAIVMEAGIHAREWISPATATYIMRELAENKNNADLIDFFDFYILPVANPDGYEYSFTSNRLWRKNRAKNRGVASLLLSLCDGVDLNRNFGYHWADALTPLHIQSGTQLNCMETYSGPGPYSEPETRNIREFVKSIQSNVVSYIPIHSYGQKILYPWSYTGVRLPDWQEMQNVGNILASAMERNSQGINYSVGSAPRTQYLAAGGSDDWARGEMGIKWVFLIELPDTGTFGFLLPATKIKGVGHSVFEGIRALAVTISRKLY